jgi:hypothetical protein
VSLNTTPRTFVTAEIETAAIFNAEVRDALTGIQAAWSTYTPTYTNLTLGNGTAVARYNRTGKTIDLRVALTGGTTSTAAGAISVSLPVAAHGSGEQDILLKVWNAANNYIGWASIAAAGTTMALYYNNSGAGGAMATWTTFANGHILVMQGTYEAA